MVCAFIYDIFFKLQLISATGLAIFFSAKLKLQRCFPPVEMQFACSRKALSELSTKFCPLFKLQQNGRVPEGALGCLP